MLFRDFENTFRFYERLGFQETRRDAHWMILKRGGIVVEFFPHADLDPASSWFSCCFRLDDVEEFYSIVLAAGVPERNDGWRSGAQTQTRRMGRHGRSID